MKKTTLFFLAFCVAGIFVKAQLQVFKETNVRFFSTTPIEDIEANNKKVDGVINPASGAVQVKVYNVGFIFPKPLMQEHFHENYMETPKYPESLLKGSFAEKIDWTKDGENDVTVKGKLTIHGVTKDVEIKGKIIIKDGKASVNAKFPVRVADYGIKIPSLVVKNIAEEVEVTITSRLEPYKK